MYAKIFESIYDGSLRKDWKALVTFQQLLVLCDEEGYIDKTPDAISARTTIPLEIITHGLKELSSADPDSRSQEENGRRIMLINPARSWGWRIVNYKSYRDIRSKEELRDYWKGQKRDYRQSQAADRTLQLKQALETAFKRKPSDRWSCLEEGLLCEIARRENCLLELQELLMFRVKRGKYFPQSIQSLLENWGKQLDVSRNGSEETGSAIQNVFAAEKQRAALQRQVEQHPANPNFVGYNARCSDGQKQDLKGKRQRLRELDEIIVKQAIS